MDGREFVGEFVKLFLKCRIILARFKYGGHPLVRFYSWEFPLVTHWSKMDHATEGGHHMVRFRKLRDDRGYEHKDKWVTRVGQVGYVGTNSGICGIGGY